VIPTMILFGLVFGHWWKSTLAAAALLWPALLLATGVIGFDSQVLGAALFGVVNAGVGVGIHQGIGWAVRSLRSRHSPVAAAPLS
jgi:hypothetical protein